MTTGNNQKTGLFASCGILLTGRKSIPPPLSNVEKMRRHSAIAIRFDSGASHGFGAGENDWLGAEAYVDLLR